MKKSQAATFNYASPWTSVSGLTFCRDNNNGNGLKADTHRVDVYSNAWTVDELLADYNSYAYATDYRHNASLDGTAVLSATKMLYLKNI